MTIIFRPDPDKIHYPVLWSNPSDFAKCADLNFKSVKGNWHAFNFEFYRKGKPEGREPNVACVTPGFAFRRDLEGLLFPEHNQNIELLPIIVAGEDWYLVNCLNSIREYNESRSIVHKDPAGSIFMVQKLIVDEFPVDNEELFTIENSNRSTIFVTESFANRVKHLSLRGLQFKKIGEVSKK